MKRFMHKKVFVIVGICLFSLLCFGGYKLYDYYQYGRYVYYEPEMVITDYAFINKNRAVVLDWDLANEKEATKQLSLKTTSSSGIYSWTIVRENYALSMYMKLMEDPTKDSFNRDRPEAGEYWKLTVYDLSTGIITAKTYDVFEIARKQGKLPLLRNNYRYTYTINGKDYLPLLLKKKNGEVDEKLSFLDLSTGQIDPNVRYKNHNIYSANMLDNSTSLSHYFAPKIKSYGSRLFLTKIGIKASQTWQLGEENPKALKLLQNGKARLYLLSRGTNVELATSTWQLLLPKGQNLFENLTIYADSTVDGKEHIVNSYEEFVKYYRTTKEVKSE